MHVTLYFVVFFLAGLTKVGAWVDGWMDVKYSFYLIGWASAQCVRSLKDQEGA